MNKRRQTRSPPFSTGARGRRARPDRPAARDRATRYRDPRERHLALEGRHGEVGQDLLALHAEYQARLKSDEQARDGPPGPPNRATRSYRSPGVRHHRCRSVG